MQLLSDLYLLTDSAELAKYEGQVEKALAGGAGTLTVKPGALAAAGEKWPGAISRQTYENLWKVRRNVSGASAAWLGTLDGRLALGGLLVNLFAIKKSLSELAGTAGFTGCLATPNPASRASSSPGPRCPASSSGT